ncbi:MAG: hypothetical protein GKR94_11625 [Gammaproteobacteria bacterium]|nr:hypothetical protein [Gammaproteobacteria bacterium]
MYTSSFEFPPARRSFAAASNGAFAIGVYDAPGAEFADLFYPEPRGFGLHGLAGRQGV